MNRPQYHAFTLVELLVVITIIALLIGILLPALASTRRSAKVVLCMTNLHSVMVGVVTYSVHHQGRIPYGPGSGRLSGGMDFFVVDGQITNQISTDTGEPMAAGLLLNDALAGNPHVMFCPGTDNELTAQRELAKVGSSFALSGYGYRHGSNTLLYTSPHTVARLDDLGTNRYGQPIRAMFMDNNFVVSPSSFYHPIFHQTNHNQNPVNIAFVDGSVSTHTNDQRQYSATVGTILYSGLELMLRAFETADSQ